MTAEMIDAKTPKTVESPEVREDSPIETQEAESWFHSLSRHEKRFHILFYALAGLTGILIVQLIWQIAVLTSTR